MKIARLATIVVALAVSGVAFADYEIGSPGGLRTKLKATNNAGVQTPHFNVDSASAYPANAVPITISATGTTSATAATLAASALTTTYICGFSARANATAAVVGNLTVAGTITGTLNFTTFTPANTAAVSEVGQNFYPCIPASAVNTTIVVTHPAPGAGGVVSVSAWGYRQ